jgi:hypothetical protein
MRHRGRTIYFALSSRSIGRKNERMGNVLSEWFRRIAHTWRVEAMFSTVTAISAFFIGKQRDVGHSLYVSLVSALCALMLFALFHLAQILWGLRIITGLHNGDPIVVVTFCDDRKAPIAVPHTASLEIKNDGSSEARWIRIHPLKLHRRVVFFPESIDSLQPTDYRKICAEVGDQWGFDSTHDLIRAMSEEWLSYPDHETRREITVPVIVDYEDESEVRFEAHFELLYHGGRGWNEPADFKCIECKKFLYRRIIPGGLVPLSRSRRLL